MLEAVLTCNQNIHIGNSQECAGSAGNLRTSAVAKWARSLAVMVSIWLGFAHGVSHFIECVRCRRYATSFKVTSKNLTTFRVKNCDIEEHSKAAMPLHHKKILNGTSIEKFHLQTIWFCLRLEFYNFFSTIVFHQLQECILRIFANVRFDLQKTKHGPASLRKHLNLMQCVQGRTSKLGCASANCEPF